MQKNDITGRPVPAKSSDYDGIFDGKLTAGKKAALILVDLAKAYFEPGSPLHLTTGSDVRNTCRSLARAARANDVPVIFTRMKLNHDGSNAGLFYRKVPSLQLFLPGSPLGEFASDCAPEACDMVVEKQYPSAFFGTPLASTLRAITVDTVVIAGFSTSGCVRATALDALQNGFVPIVARQACGDHPQPHSANLFDLGAKYAEVWDDHQVVEFFSTGPRS